MIDKRSGQPTEGDFDIEPRLDKKGLIRLGLSSAVQGGWKRKPCGTTQLFSDKIYKGHL